VATTRNLERREAETQKRREMLAHRSKVRVFAAKLRRILCPHEPSARKIMGVNGATLKFVSPHFGTRGEDEAKKMRRRR
jgi:hypothetical protein